MNKSKIKIKPTWRILFALMAVATLVAGFWAPHQWFFTIACIVLIWADKSNTTNYKEITNEDYS